MRNATSGWPLVTPLTWLMSVLLTSCAQLPPLHRPLHEAVIRGDMAEIERYAKSAEGVNAKDRYGDTALHYAYFCGRKDVIDYLVACGADANETNYVGDTPQDMEKLAAAESLVEEALEPLTSEGNREDVTRRNTIYSRLSQMDGSITTRALILKILSSDPTVNGEALGWGRVIEERAPGVRLGTRCDILYIGGRVIEERAPGVRTRAVKPPRKGAILFTPLHRFDVHPLAYYTHDLRVNLNTYDRGVPGPLLRQGVPPTAGRLQAVLLAIKLGIPASEESLSEILPVAATSRYMSTYSIEDIKVAGAYLNSGSPALEDAVRGWLIFMKSRGLEFETKTTSGGPAATWGRF